VARQALHPCRVVTLPRHSDGKDRRQNGKQGRRPDVRKKERLGDEKGDGGKQEKLEPWLTGWANGIQRGRPSLRLGNGPRGRCQQGR
jgi:hypothetical protein